MSFLRRQRLHRRVADTLERLHDGHLDEHVSDLAYHLVQAGAGERAAKYFHQAGVSAAGRLATPEALASFARAAELAGPGPTRRAALRARGELLLGLFRGREAAADLEAAVREAVDDLEFGAFVEAAAGRSPELPPAAPGQHPALGKRIRLAAGAPLARRPGAAMLCSNFGYQLLGDIVRRVSGQPFWHFVRTRVFEPLGMRDSHFVLLPELRGRRVYRAPGMPGTQPAPGLHGGADSPEYDELDSGASGAASTARDLAVFLQMLVNRGAYGGKRILSAASVAAMTRHQVDTSIPWVVPMINPATGKRMDFEFHGGGYGYGVFIFGAGDRFKANGALASLSAFGHAGYGGVYMWADPDRELVGVYLSVSPRLDRDLILATANTDLFQNAVHAAIVD